jgi:hypothetical protein
MARWFILICLIPLVLYSVGCRKAAAPLADRNKAPTTFITAGPLDSTEADYRIHIYWSGIDPDGVVIGYLVAVTDSTNVPAPPSVGGLDSLRADPRFTTKTDSLFVFTANDPLVLAHRIYIAAIDNEGKLDIQAINTGHFIYFLARNRHAPEVYIQKETITIHGEQFSSDNPVMSNGHLVPQVGVRDTISSSGRVAYCWTGSDRDPASRVVGYTYQLSIPMRPVPADSTLCAQFPDADIPPEYCNQCATLEQIQYTFSVRATDEAGAVSESGDRNPHASEAFVVGFDPLTFMISPLDSMTLNQAVSYKLSATGAPELDHVIQFTGKQTYAPSNGVWEGISQDIPYALLNGQPDTIPETDSLHFMFLAADTAGGDRGLIAGFGSTQYPLFTLNENYEDFYRNFSTVQGSLTNGLPVTFPSTPPFLVTLTDPVEYARFRLPILLRGSNYSGRNLLKVRSRDLANRYDGYHTNYPIAEFEVNRAPRYALPSTYLQAGDAIQPNASRPKHYASNPDGSGSFGTVDLCAPDTVLWVVYGPASDPDSQDVRSDWILKRAVVRQESGTNPMLTSWTSSPMSSFEGLEEGYTYLLDIAVRDHGGGPLAGPGRNWTAWSAYVRGHIPSPLSFQVRRICGSPTLVHRP